MTEEFSFIEQYRALLPNAAREEILRREPGFSSFRSKQHSTLEIQSLCRLAFGLAAKHPSEFADFQSVFQREDPTFLVERDKAEASRLSGLLLKALMPNDSETIPLMLLTTAAGNLRSLASGDQSPLLAARDELVRVGAARTHNQLLDVSSVKSNVSLEISAQLKAVQTTFDAANVVATFDALRNALVGIIVDIVNSTNRLSQATQRETAIQQENLDALWFCMTDWTRTLDRPRAEVNVNSLPLVIGIDLGNCVRIPPGAYSTGAVLRRLLGLNHHRQVTISAAVAGLEKSDQALAASENCTETLADLCPIHRALALAASTDGGWEFEFKRSTGLEADSVFTASDLAVQAFRERVLLKLVLGGS
jgi:hypothetical protein